MRNRSLFWTLVPLLLLVLPLLSAAGGEPPIDASSSLAANTFYLSGWRAIDAGQAQTLEHGITLAEPAALAVDLLMLDQRPGGLGIHRRAIGGMEVAGDRLGMHWQSLNATDITVVRNPQDVFASGYMVRLWVPPSPPQFDSGWVTVSQDSNVVLTHSLGGDPNDYVTALRFRNPAGPSGINLIGVGGMVSDEWAIGGAFSHLDDESVSLGRYPNDDDAPEMRIQIYAEPPSGPPAYDSGWVSPEAGASTVLTHGLGVTPGMLVARMSQRNETHGINGVCVGGMESDGMYGGAAWHNLTENNISVWRGSDDPYAEEVRLRIWTFNLSACVPDPIAPVEGAVLDNGCTDMSDNMTWSFEWSGCPGATAYHLQVVRPPDTPVLDMDDLATPSYTYERVDYLPCDNLQGWQWQVRAQVGGAWGDWSPVRTFTVEPPNTDCPQDVFLPFVVDP